MARPFADGPLTVTPALTYSNPKGSTHNTGDTSGSIPGSPLTRTGPYIRPSDTSLGSPISYPLTVALHNIPGTPDPESAFLISGATDMGATFSQGQLDAWTDLAIAIQLGYLTVTVAGTVPADHPL